jgi:signal transduction histidine kinase
MRLQTKLTLFNTLSKLVIVVLFVLLLPRLIGNINLNYTDNRLRKQKDKVLQKIDSLGIEQYMPDGKPYGSYTLLKEEYVGLEESPPSYHLNTIENSERIVEGDTIQYRILSHTFAHDKKNYLLEVGKSVKTIGETSSPLQSIALEVLLGMIFFTVLLDFLYADYLLRPLGKIIKAKLLDKRFPAAGPYQRINTSTYDFKYLDESIHQMIQHIEATFQKEREFISNASHELMTPITILQNKIENLSGREDISDELQLKLVEMHKTLNRLKSITKTLLLISQIENEQFLKEDTISVSELLNDVSDEISIRLQDKNIRMNIEVTDDKTLHEVNRFLLFNLFFNLVNNAIKYNKEQGDIAIKAFREDGSYVIEVSDTGIGIPEEQVPFIFNRFKKFKRSAQQESFGLGLPIVKSIADFHKIGIEVSSELGAGSRFRLIFP